MNNMQEAPAARDTSGASVPNIAAAPLVRMDRRFLLFSLVATMLLSWPLLVFGHPSYIQDSAAYYKGGRAAVSFALANLFSPETISTTQSASQDPASAVAAGKMAGNEIKAARSVTYSIAAYALSAPRATLLVLALAQAAATAMIIVATLGAFGGLSARRTAISLLALSLTTTVAPVSVLLIPDIFAGLLIGSMVLLATALSRLSLGVRLLCVGIAAFAVTAHPSNIPIAAGMTALGIVWTLVSHFRRIRQSKWALLWVGAPLLIGGLTLMAINRVAFGESSLAGKRYPFALSRSVNNGPGRWYLEKNCPHLRYAICELYPHGLPKGGALEFLWGPEGVTMRATPAQMDRIRAEEAEIVLAAAREYSGYEIRRLAGRLGWQLVRFRPVAFDEQMTLDPTGTPQLRYEPQANGWILNILFILSAISAVMGSVCLAWAFFKERALRPVVTLLFLGILGNAVTCVLFAAMAERYQARVIWLIPLLALALIPAMGAAPKSGKVEPPA